MSRRSRNSKRAVPALLAHRRCSIQPVTPRPWTPSTTQSLPCSAESSTPCARCACAVACAAPRPSTLNRCRSCGTRLQCVTRQQSRACAAARKALTKERHGSRQFGGLPIYLGGETAQPWRSGEIITRPSQPRMSSAESKNPGCTVAIICDFVTRSFLGNDPARLRILPCTLRHLRGLDVQDRPKVNFKDRHGASPHDRRWT